MRVHLILHATCGVLKERTLGTVLHIRVPFVREACHKDQRSFHSSLQAAGVFRNLTCQGSRAKLRGTSKRSAFLRRIQFVLPHFGHLSFPAMGRNPTVGLPNSVVGPMVSLPEQFWQLALSSIIGVLHSAATSGCVVRLVPFLLQEVALPLRFSNCIIAV